MKITCLGVYRKYVGPGIVQETPGTLGIRASSVRILRRSLRERDQSFQSFPSPTL